MSDIGSLNRMFFSWKRNLQRHAVSFAILVGAVLFSLIGIPGGSLAASIPTPGQNPAEVQNTADIRAEGTESIQAITDSADIAAEKVDQFAQAYMQILQLLSDREPELPAAETTAEALKIERSIEAEAVTIIESTGLTLPEYMQILGLASQDSTFQDKILGRIDDTAESN